MSSSTSTETISVLFVCLGNICRSPLAEGLFRHLVERRGLSDRYRIDSAGTGSWHLGEPPDPRSREVAEAHGVVLTGRARQVTPEDFAAFDHLVAMDRQNLAELRSLQEALTARGEEAGARLHLLRDHDPEAEEGAEVPDPYYGGADGFERAYELVLRSCRGLLDDLESEEPPV